MTLSFNKENLKIDNLFYQQKNKKKSSLSPKAKFICNSITLFIGYMCINTLFAFSYLEAEARAEIEKANSVFQLSSNITDSLEKKDYKTLLNEAYTLSKTQNLVNRAVFNQQTVSIYQDKDVPIEVREEMLTIAKNADKGLTLKDPLVNRSLSLNCGYLNIMCNIMDNKLDEINTKREQVYIEVWKESSYNLNNLDEYIKYANLPFEEIKKTKRPYEKFLENKNVK